ncbi:MAG: bleomycin resistance protein [Verrucomicrobiales bacterium]
MTTSSSITTLVAVATQSNASGGQNHEKNTGEHHPQSLVFDEDSEHGKMSRGKCTAITPMVPVGDLDRAIEFYVGVLGFNVGVQFDGYAYIVRDAAAIRLLATGQGAGAGEQSCYICVEQIDTLYEELKPALDQLSPGRVRAPFDQPYGQREFHVIDEDGLLIFFGEAV